MNKTYTKNTFIKLLSGMSSEKEIRKYIERFSSDDYRFALIKVGGAILKNDIDNLISSIGFLNEVGLIPIIVHGAGPMLSERLEKEKIDFSFIDGQRVSSEKVLQTALEVFAEENTNLVNLLNENNINAVSFVDDIFNCEINNPELGYVGDVVGVKTAMITKAISKGFVPVISPLGKTKSTQDVNINADMATLALAKEIMPDKVVFLSEVGGIFNENNQLITNININDDYEQLMSESWLHSGMKLKLQQIKLLTDILPSKSSVSITTSLHLSKELFTDAGSGTLVKAGHNISGYDFIDKNQTEFLKSILESSFNGKLVPNYFNTGRKSYLISECERSAIVLSNDHSVTYMDKFSVIPSAKGEGLGNAMWKKMIKENRKIFWRSASTNSINKFYKDVADGFQKIDKWHIFWIGIDDLNELVSCIQFASKQPRTIIYD
jgi:acetylglutamate kinase